METISDTILMEEFRALFAENEFRLTTKEYYEWKFFRNPYHQGKIYLESRDAKVVGSTTITFKKISILGKELLGAEIGDTFTHPEYRRQGIFSRGVNACTEYAILNGVKVIYGTPNSESLPGYQSKLGYPPCSFIKLNYMTKYRQGFLSNAVKSIAKMIRRRKKEKFFNILTADEFTDKIDGIWGSPRYAFFNIRDEIYLNWRYFKNPDEYKVIVAKKADDYLGYVVTKLSKNGKIGTICDFITSNDRMDVFHMLIEEAETSFEKAGVQSIQLLCVENSKYYQALLAHAYYDHGSASRQPVIVFSGTEYGKKLLESDAKWHFTLSDSDNI